MTETTPVPRTYINVEKIEWHYDFTYDDIRHYSLRPAVHIETYDGRMFYFGSVHGGKFLGYDDSGLRVTIPIERARAYAVVSRNSLQRFQKSAH